MIIKISFTRTLIYVHSRNGVVMQSVNFRLSNLNRMIQISSHNFILNKNKKIILRFELPDFNQTVLNH
jgi:hypothetical protein